MKTRIIVALAILAIATSCTTYKTCATYSKNTTPPVKEAGVNGNRPA